MLKQTPTIEQILRIRKLWKSAGVNWWAYFVFWFVLSLFFWIVIPGIILQYIDLIIKKRKERKK